MNSSEGSLAFLSHILRLFGLAQEDIARRIDVLIRPSQLDAQVMIRASQGAIVIAIQPGDAFCHPLGVAAVEVPLSGNANFACPGPSNGVGKFRTLHASFRFEGEGEPVVLDDSGRPVWLFLPKNEGGILLVGTALVADLICYRQGDPTAVAPREAMWDIAGERPIYLFEKQIAGLPRYQERQADFWSMIAARFLADKLRSPLSPILPGGAPGAIVITGDDDQAYLEKYSEQLKLLGNTPITYFLHPLTRHTPATLSSMLGKSSVDLGIHPDALESPGDYARLLKEQCAWFERLVGKRASSLRNHGFLNDGYWGHLKPWIDEGISFSTNIPGLDGCAVNGSLLPARVYDDGCLTGHWSVVTAIGDGVRYVNGGKSDVESANCIFDLADAIRQSAIPGVMLLNFHPQNVGDTRAMHLAAREVIRSGFIAWNMRDCLDWFANGIASTPAGSFRRTLDRILPSWANAIFPRGGGLRAGAKKKSKGMT